MWQSNSTGKKKDYGTQIPKYIFTFPSNHAVIPPLKKHSILHLMYADPILLNS